MTEKHAVKEIEALALKLSVADRTSLVGSIVKSLVPPEDEIMNAWLDEAERRDREMGEDPGAGIPADEVLRRARAHIS